MIDFIDYGTGEDKTVITVYGSREDATFDTVSAYYVDSDGNEVPIPCEVIYIEDYPKDK